MQTMSVYTILQQLAVVLTNNNNNNTQSDKIECPMPLLAYLSLSLLLHKMFAW